MAAYTLMYSLNVNVEMNVIAIKTLVVYTNPAIYLASFRPFILMLRSRNACKVESTDIEKELVKIKQTNGNLSNPRVYGASIHLINRLNLQFL